MPTLSEDTLLAMSSEETTEENPARVHARCSGRWTPLAVSLGLCTAAAVGICIARSEPLWSGTADRSKGGGSGSGFAIEAVMSLDEADPGGRYIRWKAHPDKCIGVWGHQAGAMVQLWTCNDFNGAAVKRESEFKWILPPAGQPGPIVWAGNTSYCLNAPQGTKVQIWYCDTAPVRHTRWKITADGRIRLAYHTDKCLDIPNGDRSIADGILLQLWDCLEEDTVKEGNVLYDVNPQDCEWSLWSDWSTCSVTCGEGHRYQARRFQKQAANGGRACGGPNTKAQPCTIVQCAADEGSSRSIYDDSNSIAPSSSTGTITITTTTITTVSTTSTTEGCSGIMCVFR